MKAHSVADVGLGTSKPYNAVAIAEPGRDGEVSYLGEIDNTSAATARLVRKLSAKHAHLEFCYEAGPTGYGRTVSSPGGARLHRGGAVVDPVQAG